MNVISYEMMLLMVFLSAERPASERVPAGDSLRVGDQVPGRPQLLDRPAQRRADQLLGLVL